MGVEEKDLETSLGVVDIWHWELDCGPGEMTGGGDRGSGDDPECNFDDEYAPNPEDREDDGGGDTPNNPTGENSLSGVWKHTAAAAGGDGTWIFEMSRPLQTGDTQDAQFASGEKALPGAGLLRPQRDRRRMDGCGTPAERRQRLDRGSTSVGLLSSGCPGGAWHRPDSPPARTAASGNPPGGANLAMTGLARTRRSTGQARGPGPRELFSWPSPC